MSTRGLLSHKNPVLSHGELLSILLEKALEKHCRAPRCHGDDSFKE